MKVEFAALALASFVAFSFLGVVLAESGCSSDPKLCTETRCSDTVHKVICVDDTCTCSSQPVDDHSCMDQVDCSMKCGPGPQLGSHCVDGKCHCLHEPASHPPGPAGGDHNVPPQGGPLGHNGGH